MLLKDTLLVTPVTFSQGGGGTKKLFCLNLEGNSTAGSQNQDYLTLYKFLETDVSPIIQSGSSRRRQSGKLQKPPFLFAVPALGAGKRAHQKPLLTGFLELVPSLSANCSEQKQYCHLPRSDPSTICYPRAKKNPPKKQHWPLLKKTTS